MTWASTFWELGRLVYSIGLLILGGVIIKSLPMTVRVLGDLTRALTATAAGLHTQAIDRDELQQIRSTMERLERGQADDHRTLGEIKALLERASTGTSGERPRMSSR